MWTLTDCEIWRDGGSCSVTLAEGDRVTSLWLQVSSWDRPGDRRHVALFVSDGHDATRKEQQVPLGEPTQDWLRILEHGVLRKTGQPEIDSRFDEFVAHLRWLAGQEP